MAKKFVIRRGDKDGSFEEWNDDEMKFGPEGSFPFFAREVAEHSLSDVPKRFKASIVEIDDDDDDHGITDDGYPDDL